MSLATPATGLLETHVTWDDVEEQLRSSLNTNARFGPNKKATYISDMKGFMSRVASIEPDWIDASDDENLPSKFAVKIPTQMALVVISTLMNGEPWPPEKLKEMEVMTRTLHNREVEALRMLTKANNPLIKFPKVYSSLPFTPEAPLKAYIISELIENCQHVPNYENISADDLIPVIKAIAAFSALGEKMTDEDVAFAKGVDLLKEVTETIINDKTADYNKTALLKAFPVDYHQKVEKWIEICRKSYLDHRIFNKYRGLLKEHHPVLTHGDIGSHNMLLTKNGSGIEFRAVIDFQTCSFSSPAADITKIIFLSLSAKDRRQRAPELLKIYYDTFVSQLSGSLPPYTWQQLQKSYNLYFPFVTSNLLVTMISFLKTYDIPEVQEKIQGILDDVLELHESNLENYPEFYNLQ